jgi:hypothetical protein
MDEECRRELRQLIEDKKEGLVSTPELLKLRAVALDRSLTRQAKGGVCGVRRAEEPANMLPPSVLA